MIKSIQAAKCKNFHQQVLQPQRYNTIVIIIFSNNITPIEVHLHQQFTPNNYDGCQIVSNAFHLQLLTVWYPVQNHDCLSKPVSDTIDKIQLQCCKDALLTKQLLSGEPVLHQSRWDRQQKSSHSTFQHQRRQESNNMKTETRHYCPSFYKTCFHSCDLNSKFK